MGLGEGGSVDTGSQMARQGRGRSLVTQDGGAGEREQRFTGAESQFGKGSLGVDGAGGCTATSVYLMSLNCDLTKSKDGKFCVMCILSHAYFVTIGT